MIHCPSCKSEIESGSWYCDQCGIELKCCVSCGNVGENGQCVACGDNLIPARLYTTTLGKTVQPAESSFIRISAINRNIKIKRPVKFYLVNYPLGIRFEAVDGAIIGRKAGPYASLLKNHAYVSGRHAIVKHGTTENEWIIIDQDSSNGTYINGERITALNPAQIKEGDKIQLANIELIVELE